jgi:hypothetical protein
MHRIFLRHRGREVRCIIDSSLTEKIHNYFSTTSFFVSPNSPAFSRQRKLRSIGACSFLFLDLIADASTTITLIQNDAPLPEATRLCVRAEKDHGSTNDFLGGEISRSRVMFQFG